MPFWYCCALWLLSTQPPAPLALHHPFCPLYMWGTFQSLSLCHNVPLAWFIMIFACWMYIHSVGLLLPIPTITLPGPYAGPGKWVVVRWFKKSCHIHDFWAWDTERSPKDLKPSCFPLAAPKGRVRKRPSGVPPLDYCAALCIPNTIYTRYQKTPSLAFFTFSFFLHFSHFYHLVQRDAQSTRRT